MMYIVRKIEKESVEAVTSYMQQLPLENPSALSILVILSILDRNSCKKRQNVLDRMV